MLTRRSFYPNLIYQLLIFQKDVLTIEGNEDLTGVPKRIWRHPVEPEEPDVSSEHTMYHDIDQTVTLLCYILSYVLGREV